ncbi:MAG: transglycosylase SLT domain-containing protein [Candidatus Saccharibacteria bacterium]|nr:transglycosylase SLT domain-containing protein [Moraxellaceae bacterium]
MRPISDWLAFSYAFFSLNSKTSHLEQNTTLNVTTKNLTANLLTDQIDQPTTNFSLRSLINHSIVKKPIFVVSVITAGLALQGFSDTTQLDQVIESHKLRVVSVAGDSTFFKSDSFLHGFGYEMSREFSRDLRVNLEFRQVASTAAALNAVKQGKADIALTTATNAQLQAKALASVDLSCGNSKTLSSQGLNTAVNWSFRNAADPLVSSGHGFVCDQRQMGSTKQLASFYNRSLMNDQVEKIAFSKALNTRLPILKASFQMNAKQQNLDWQLLAAVSYQESHLVATAISPTGVSGLMMLTQVTAKEMGISNRNDPAQSIKGGAKYLQLMLKQYASIPDPDRLWFSLAAYNMGSGNVDRVRNALKKAGKNPNNWADTYQYLTSHAASNSQYGQCIHYVTRIRGYLEAMKQDRNLAQV